MRYLGKMENIGIERVTIKLWSTMDPRRCIFIKTSVADQESNIVHYPKKWRGEITFTYEDIRAFAITAGLNVSPPHRVLWEEIGTW